VLRLRASLLLLPKGEAALRDAKGEVGRGRGRLQHAGRRRLVVRLIRDALLVVVRRGADLVQAAIDGQRKYDSIRAMFTSEDLIEGPMAFAQKRPPQWKGK
jgi:enoyl-CoA hydratase/carnithine racemase